MIEHHGADSELFDGAGHHCLLRTGHLQSAIEFDRLPQMGHDFFYTAALFGIERRAIGRPRQPKSGFQAIAYAQIHTKNVRTVDAFQPPFIIG